MRRAAESREPVGEGENGPAAPVQPQQRGAPQRHPQARTAGGQHGDTGSRGREPQREATAPGRRRLFSPPAAALLPRCIAASDCRAQGLQERGGRAAGSGRGRDSQAEGAAAGGGQAAEAPGVPCAAAHRGGPGSVHRSRPADREPPGRPAGGQLTGFKDQPTSVIWSHVADRDEAVAMLTTELRAAQERLRSVQEEYEVQQGALCTANEELQRWPAEARAQVDKAQNRLQQYLSSTERLGAHRDQAQRQQRQAEQEALQHNAQVQHLEGRSAQLQAQDESLGALRRQLEESRQHGLECELVIGTLHRQVEEQEEAVVKIQTDFSLYKATHLLSDPDCEPHLCRIQELQQELSCAVERLAQDAQELGLYQADVCQLKEEVGHLTKHRNSDITEALRLQEAVGQLQGKMAAEPRRRRVEKQAFHLQGELQATQQKEKMEVMLKEVEPPLVDTNEVIREQSLVAERPGLEADLQRAMKENQQGETESATLRAELLHLQEELKVERSRCKNMAEALARQKKEALLAERGQQGALGDRVAWPQQEERWHQAELRVLRDELRKMEHHGQGGRSQVGTLTVQVSEGRIAQLVTSGAEHPEKELTSKWGGIGTQQQQLKEQEEHIISMSELDSATLRLQEEIDSGQAQLLQCTAELDAKRTENLQLKQELESLRSEATCAQQRATALEDSTRRLTDELQKLRSTSGSPQEQAQTYEGRLAEVCTQLARSQCWGQEQLATLEAKEAEAVTLRVELTSLRENYCAKVMEVGALHSQLDLMRQKYQAAANEVDVLRRFLGNARTNSIRLHHESELVVSSVHQWVKEQKQVNEKLRTKIKEQSRKIKHLTTEKNLLQEHREQLLEDMRMLKVQLDGQRMDVEGLVAHHQPGACRGGRDEQALREGNWKRPASLSQHPRQPLAQKSIQPMRGIQDASSEGPKKKKKALAANLYCK